MPSKTVDGLVMEVFKVHEKIGAIESNVEWLKKGVIGLIAGNFSVFVAVVINALLK